MRSPASRGLKRATAVASAPDSPAERTGTQSVERALRILRELAARGEFGWRLSDLAARCEIDKGTAHRVLACLVRERFVQQRAADRHYFPGPMLYELGLSLPGYVGFQHAVENRLRKFSAQTAAVTWLILRSGNEYVCAVREGKLELRGMMVRVGTRRPLFTSVGGVAILQTLPHLEARALLDDNTQQEVAQRGDGRLAALKRMRRRSREHGFGVNLGDVVPGVHAFAVPVNGPDGRAFAAVGLAGAAEQFDESRIPEVRQALDQVAADVTHLLYEHLSDVLQWDKPARDCTSEKFK